MAKARRNDTVKLIGLARRNRHALMLSTALQATTLMVLALPGHAQPAPNAQPTGGVVIGGSAAISHSATNTQINQSTQRAAIDWKSFNVGSQQSVTFQQPSTSAVTLNRVTGPDPSQIAGRITANGQVALINQSGVMFYKGAQVNTAGLVVSAIGMTNQAVNNFVAGGPLALDQAAKANARVENHGNITIKEAGLAALVAPHVANRGTITARLGNVVLAGAKTATLDLYGDGLLALNVNNQVTETPIGADGQKVTALVTNSGLIVADGGTVQLTARAADGVVQNLVQAGGKIRAASVGDKTGVVALNGVGGSIVVEGQLSAPGAAPGTKGGSIEVASNAGVTVAPTARISANGKAGGGTVAIGTTLNRAKDLKAAPAVVAQKVSVQKGATITANATDKGDGGRVVVLSDLSTGITRMDGRIEAKGGAAGGTGGFVEVSGNKLGMDDGAAIDTGAPLGNNGTILFDPRDLSFVAEGPDNGQITATGVPVGNPDQNTDIAISASAATALTGTLIFEASRDIFVNAPLAFTNQGAGDTVLMLAGRDLTVNQSITTNGGALSLNSAVASNGSVNFANFDPAGKIAINADIGGTTLGAVTLTSGSGGITLGASVAGTTVEFNTTGGGVTQTAGGITAATLQSGGVAGDVTLASATNKIDALGNFGVTGGFTLVDSNALTVSGTLSTSGNVFLQNTSPGGIAVTGAVTSVASSTTGLQADAIALSGAVIAGTVELAPNTPGTAVTLGAAGGLSLSQATLSKIGTGVLRIGAVTSGGVTTSTTNAISIGGPVDLANITIALDLRSNIAVGEAVGGSLVNVGTLTGTSQSFDVTQAGNTIGNIGSYAVTGGGDFKLAVDGALAIAGPLTAANVEVTTAGVGSAINTTGKIAGTTAITLKSGTITLGTGADVGAPTVTLTGDTGIALNDNALLGVAGAVVDLNTTSGGITQASTGTIVAATLRSTNGAGGTVSLLGAPNAVDKTGKFAVTGGDFALATTTGLTVNDQLSATNVFLQSANAAGITIGGAGAVTANAAGRASIQADAFVNNGAVSAGTFEFAPNTSGLTLTLGAAAPTPALANLIGITATDVRLGAVTQPGAVTPTIRAGAINVAGAFGLAATNLELDTTGAITQAAAATLTANTLSGTAATVTLPQANNIRTLASFAATAGDFLLSDTGAATLTVSGPVTGTNVTINGTPTLEVTGSIGATATVSLGGGGIEFDPGAAVTGATIVLDGGANGITFTGNAAIGQAGGTVDINSGGTVAEAATSVITAGTLLSSFGVNSKVTLLGTANAIANLGDFAVTGASFALLDGQALQVVGKASVTGASNQLSLEAPSVTIAAAGALNADAGSGLISLHTDTFANSGKISVAALELAPITAGRTVTLGAAGDLSLLSLSNITTSSLIVGAVTPPGGARTTTAGGIAIGGTFDATGVPLVTLNANGAVTQTAPLIGGSQVTGSADSYALLDANNAISALGLTANNGDIQVRDASTLVLAANKASGGIFVSSPSTLLVGVVSAGGVLGLQTDNLTFIAGLLSGTTVELAPLTTGATQILGAAGGLLNPAFITGNLRIGAVTVPGSGLVTTAGSIVVGGNFGSSALVLELDSLGGIGQTAGAILTAGTLAGSAGTGVNLTTNANAIGTLGSFAVTSGAFALNDGGLAGNLTVGGPVTGPTITLQNAPTITVAGSIGAGALASLTSGAGGIAVQGAGIVSGPTVTLNGGTGGIALAGGAQVGSAGGTVDLSTAAGGIAAVAGAVITAGTLQSSGGVVGAFNLSASSNDIANLGSIAVSGGAFSLNDAGHAGTLGVAGPVTAANVTIVSGTGALTVTGSIGAGAGTVSLDGANPTAGIVLNSGAVVTGGTINVNGGTVGIALNGSASLGNAGAVVDLTTSGGGVTEAATAVITAATLQSTGGVVGNADLLGTANAVASLGDFAVTGGTNHVALNDSVALVVAGTVTAPGQVFLETSAAGGIAIAATGSIDAGTLASFQAAALTNAGTVTAAQFEFAPDTVGGTQTLTTLPNIPTNVRIGAVTQPGAGAPITRAGSIVVDSAFGTAVTALELASLGDISQSLAGAITAATVTGQAGGAVSLTANNQIATVGDFSAADFTLNNGLSLALAGTLNGGSGVTINDTGTLTINSGATVSATAVSLTANAIAIAGLSTDGGTGTTALVATAGTISETGTIIAGTLSGSSVGATSLTGATDTTNQIANIGNFSASGFTLNNGTDLTVVGALAGGPSATIVDKGTFTIAGGGTVSAAAISVTANDIAIAGLSSDGGAGTTNLVATTGTIAGTGTIVAGTLSGKSVGATSLTGATATANQIASISDFSAVGFTLNDGVALNVTGTLAGGPSVTIVDKGSVTIAGSGTVSAAAISVTASDISITGLSTDGGGSGTTSLVATTGTISETGTIISGTLTGSAAGAVSLTGKTPTTNDIATLGNFSASGFTLNDGVDLTVTGTLAGGPSATIVDKGTFAIAAGGTVSATAVSVTANDIAITGLSTDGGGAGTTNLIATTGTISETGTIIAGTLTGSSAGVTSLTGATATTNQIASLGDFSATGFTLNDGVDLAVTGTLNGGPSVAIVDNGTLSVSGTIAATTVDLTANDIAITGVVTDGGAGTTNLIATTGTIDETGTIIAGTLTGSSAGGTSLTGASPTANQIANIGTFTASGFALNDGIGATVIGVLNGGPSVTVVDQGTFTIAGKGTVAATAISVTANDVTITGLSTDGGTGTTSLIATTGTISETGTIIAGTLSGKAAGTASLTGTAFSNQIGTLAGFSAVDFTLNDGVALNVTGPVNVSKSVTINDATALLVSGTIAPTSGSIAVGLTAATIDIAGLVSDGGTGTTSLVANGGTIGETGALIAGTLSGSAVGAASLIGTNQIGTLASFAAPDFTLNNTTNLNVTGPVNVSNSVTINDAAALLVSGTIAPTSGSIAVGLTAATIDITGLVSDGGTGTTSLVASGGTIGETGALIVGTLSGSAVGAASLIGTNQIGTLASFAASDFTLNNTTDLNVTGPVTVSSSVTINDEAALLVSGTIAPSSGAITVGLTAATIDITGLVSDGGTGTTSLVANGGTISETGSLIVGTLSGSASTSGEGAELQAASLIGTNQIGTLASFVASDFTLNNTTALNVTGPVTVSESVTINDAAALLVSGTIAPTSGAITVGLTAATIDITGLVSDGGTGTTRLVANNGTIGETGALIVGTLSGSASSGGALQAASLIGTNRIGTLASFTASDFALNDTTALNVTGPVSVSKSATINDAAALLVSGTIAPTSGPIAVGLTGATIDITGLVSDGGTGTTSLVANGGTIGETGMLIVGTLSGSAVGAAGLLGASPTANQIADISAFAAQGFTLRNGSNLAISGPLDGGPSVTVTNSGILTIGSTGTVSGSAISLTASDIVFDGTITDGGVGTTNLVATTGSILQASVGPRLNAGTLSGSAAAAALFQSGNNSVANLGTFTTPALTLIDSTNLNVTGNVTIGSQAEIRSAGGLTVSGSIQPPGGTGNIALLLEGVAGINIAGLVSDGGAGTTALITANAITEPGTLVSGTLSASAGGAASLTGASTTANRIANLSAVTANGFSLNNGIDLTIGGPVSGGPFATVLNKGGINVTGALTAGGITLTGDSIAIPGNVVGANVALFGTIGGITETGVLIADLLTGSAAASASFTGATLTANQVGNVGDFTANGFILNNGVDTNIIGALNGGPSVAILDSGNLLVAPGGSVTSTGISLQANAITIAGLSNDGGGTTSLIATTGTIGETGTIIAGTLSGSAPGAVSLLGASPAVNQIGTVSNFTAPGFALNDGANLTISGKLDGGPAVTVFGAQSLTVGSGASVTGAAVAITANGNIDIPGAILNANSVNLISNNGSINETGLLVAGLLTGRAAGDALFTGAGNQVQQLGGFSAANFTLVDSAALRMAGPLTASNAIRLTGTAGGAAITLDGAITAPTIVINAAANTVTLTSNTVITTGGSVRPPTVAQFPGDTPATEVNGTFITTSGGFTQQGDTVVQGLGPSPSPSVLRINALGSADITFDPTAGLQGKNSTWLILGIDGGAVTGQVNVEYLDVIRAAGATGRVDLTGTVKGLGGTSAAGVSGIDPSPNPNFRINQCPIRSVNCVLLPAQGIPVANPLNDIYFGSVFNPDDEDELLLPIVSDQDY